MLEVRGVSCSRNDEPLFSDLSFKVEEGTALQIRAANGVGKTTLLKTIAGLLTPDVGQIITPQPLLYIGHKTNLHPALTPIQNLEFLCAMSTPWLDITRAQLDDALDFVGLNAQRDILCEDLSAGQCQRVNLARMHLCSCKLWILDEPLVHLDSNSKDLFLKICSTHLAAAGLLLLATHNDLNLTDYEINTLHLENYA